MAKKLTYLVWYKVGSLDLMLPIMAHLRQLYPDIQLTILIAELNKSYLIRSGRFYKLFCDKHQIQFLDLLNFLPITLRPFSKILRYFIQYPARDGVTHNSLYDFISSRLTKWIEHIIQYDRIEEYLKNSTLLMNEQWWDELRILKRIPFDKTVILVPHGPVYLCHPQIHQLNESVIIKDKYFLFEVNNHVGVLYDSQIQGKDVLVLPYGKAIVPVRSLGSFNQASDSRFEDQYVEVERLTFIGAPCFDLSWFEMVSNIFQTDSAIRNLIPSKRKNIRCLFLMRDIVDTDQSKKVTLTEFKKIFQTIIDDIVIPHNAEVIIKPHPRQSPKKLRDIIEQFTLENYTVVDDNISITLLESDLAITVHSSGSYYPMIYGIPCIHIYKRDYPNQPLFNEMEQNLQRVVFNLDDLGGACRALINDLTNGRPIPNDTAHMRKYYPDGATELIMEQLRPYLED